MRLVDPSFIPLYFDETEDDLWSALRQIEPQRRSAFIKETLRQVLLGEGKAEGIREDPAPLDISFKDTGPEYLEHLEHSHDPGHNLVEEIQSFSLEALFTDLAEPEAEFEGNWESGKAKPSSLIQPWDNLLNEVIGKEEDEAVIQAVIQAVHSADKQQDQGDDLPKEMKNTKFLADGLNDEDQNDMSGEPNRFDLSDEAKEPAGQPERAANQDSALDLESLQVDIPIPFKGLEYLLRQVIGTEEDEAVLRAIRGPNS